MRRFWLGIALFALAFPAWAVGVWIPAGDGTDMVHDDARGLVYIANATKVLRYQLSTNTFLPPIVVGGNVGAIDLSLGNQTLVATDRSANRLVLVNLDTLQPTSVIPVTPGFTGYGTFSVAYGWGGRIYLNVMDSSGLYGRSRLVAYTPVNGAWTNLGEVETSTMLVASADRRTIAFAEFNRSDGPWGAIDVATNQVFLREGYTNGVSRQNGKVGVDAHGLQFSLTTDVSTYVYDGSFNKIAMIGPTMSNLPAGSVYHPVEALVYYPWVESSSVRTYSSLTRTQVGGYDMGRAIGPVQSQPYTNGHARISRDGSLLMVVVPDGVHVHRQYAELYAKPLWLHVFAGSASAIALPAKVGNGGQLAYSIVVAPAHGKVSLAGRFATYTPAPGYLGADEFVFGVKYGLAERRATISLQVDPPPMRADDGRKVPAR